MRNGEVREGEKERKEKRREEKRRDTVSPMVAGNSEREFQERSSDVREVRREREEGRVWS